VRVYRNTIRKRFDKGQFGHAFRDPPGRGPWRVPISDLIAAGLTPNVYRAEVELEPPEVATPEARGLAGEVARLREELQAITARAAVAEAVAQEHANQIASLETALRILEARNPPSAEVPRDREDDRGDRGGAPVRRRRIWVDPLLRR
jgi:hypothetical protein